MEHVDEERGVGRIKHIVEGMCDFDAAGQKYERIKLKEGRENVGVEEEFQVEGVCSHNVGESVDDVASATAVGGRGRGRGRWQPHP